MSPITQRKEIQPDLDELETEFYEAFEEYRSGEVYNYFTNYKNYY
jgi:hypothetical protein